MVILIHYERFPLNESHNQLKEIMINLIFFNLNINRIFIDHVMI